MKKHDKLKVFISMEAVRWLQFSCFQLFRNFTLNKPFHYSFSTISQVNIKQTINIFYIQPFPNLLQTSNFNILFQPFPNLTLFKNLHILSSTFPNLTLNKQFQ